MSASQSVPGCYGGWKPTTNPGESSQYKRLLTLRRFIRSRQVLGMTLKKSDYGLGWQIGHVSCQWTLLTLYIDQSGGFSLYRCVPDINKGTDIEDERLVIRTKELHLLRCRWDAEWYVFFYGEPPNVIRGTWEGKLEQRF